MPDAHGNETDDERLDRELDQLLQELRVAMPGVQVLFAFLLAVPFQQRFAQVSEFQRTVYFVTLLASAAASALFIAPTAYHRLMFRGRDKPRLVALSSRLALAGLVALAVAMNGVILLVTDVLFREHDGDRHDARLGGACSSGCGSCSVPCAACPTTAAARKRRPRDAARRAARHRRHADRLQLPPRAGVVPRVSPARPGDPRLALSPRDRDGRRPAREVPRRRRLREASRGTSSACRRRRSTPS